jgi:predicted DNA-binding transcriptional regulator YafY
MAKKVKTKSFKQKTKTTRKPPVKDEKRNGQIIRTLRLVHLFISHRSGFTVQNLLAQLKNEGIPCNTKMIYRDMEALEAAFFPLIKEGRIYKISPNAKSSFPVVLDFTELIALFIARESLQSFPGTPITSPLTSMFNKVEATLGPKLVALSNQLRKIYTFQMLPKSGTMVPSEVHETIDAACAEQQVLEIEYRATAKKATIPDSTWDYVKFKVGPEYIIIRHDGTYLYAKRLDTDEFRLYAFPRIKSAICLEDAYQAVHQGDNKIHRDSFGVLTSGQVSKIVIEICEPIANYVAERNWHPSQKIARTKNGIELQLEVRVNDELARWILGLGPAALVKAPKNLADLVKQLAEEVVEKAS